MGLSFNLADEAKGNELDTEILYDTIIIGGGPAGLSAALYAKRKGLLTGIIAGQIGGQVVETSSVENYLGFKSVSGQALMQSFEEHIKGYEIPTTTGTLVESIKNDNSFKVIKTDNGKSYKAKSIIISTGSKPRMLGVPGEKEFLGKGVAYCAICDGPLFEGLDVIISGGGNSAVEAAIDLAKIANTVTIVHRSQFRADQVLIDRLKQLNNVTVHLQTEIREIHGERLLTHIIAFDKNEKKEIEIAANGLFVEIGYLPKSEVFAGLLELNDKKEIIVDRKAKTSIDGIFAAGDVTNNNYKQIIISAAEGATAALSANDYINKL